MDPASLHPLLCFAYQTAVWCLNVIRSGRNRWCSPSTTPTRVRLSRMQFSQLYFLHEFLLVNFSLQSFLAFIYYSCPLFLTFHLHAVINSRADKIFHHTNIFINANQYRQIESVTLLFIVFLGEYMLHTRSKTILAWLNSAQLYH